MKAKYASRCTTCDTAIEEGDEIAISPDNDGWVHHECMKWTPGLGQDHAPRPLCPHCFVELPKTGVCECRE